MVKVRCDFAHKCNGERIRWEEKREKERENKRDDLKETCRDCKWSGHKVKRRAT